ncbi:MAG: PAS domain S-box protein [Chroococcidiopsidaceae cyanobacterium CP_BM_ER_R8_30]|nr:PAS domain S-box protein [Chroococcidiopsidaceae cyanobacterium CP_BM_ER_R8_30]
MQRESNYQHPTNGPLQDSDALLRAMIENLPGGAAFVVDRNLRYLLAEGEALATAGFKSEDFVGRTIFEVLPPELITSYEPMYRQALTGEPFEHEHHAHNRAYISRGMPLRTANGEVDGVLVVSYDITERKRTEAALRESEERFRLFVTASSDIVYRMSPDWHEMRHLESKNFLLTTDDPSRTWIETYIPPEEQPRVWAAIQAAIHTKSLFELEHRVIQRDGTIGWIFSRAIPMLNEQGEIVEWFGTASAVTDRKCGEEGLRESEERFRTLANTAPALIWYNDAQGNNRFINQYFLDFTGKSAEQIRGEGWHELVHSDDAEFYIADYLAAVREQRSWHNRNRIRRHDGVWRWHDNYAQPLFSADGVYLGHVGVTIDNTDAIEAEIALRESEAKYRSLFNSIEAGFCIIEIIFDENEKPIDYRFLEVNTAFEEQTGLVEAQGKRIRELDLDHETHWFEIYGNVALTGEPIRFENVAAQLHRWYDVYAFRVSEPKDRKVAILFTDITERKRTEAQLRHAAEIDAFRVKLSDALRSLTDPIEIQSVAMRLLGEQLQVDRVLYAEIEPDDETILIHDNYVKQDVPKIVGRFRISDFTQSSAKLRAGQRVIISDVAADPEVAELDRASLLALDIRAAMVIPLIKGGRWAISMGVYHTTARAWSEDDILLIEETAERTWAAVERARAEAALRESEIQRVREQSAREEERQRAEALAELDRMKTLFFSNVSHEFRTPLTLSLAPLQDALSDRAHPLAPVTRERLELVHHNSLRLLKLVNTLLDFSRIEAGRMEAVYEPVDLAIFTTELASVFRSAIERAGLQLIVDCPPLPEPVFVDRQMWEKIVLNLLSNAFKFTFQGEIRVSLHSTDGNQAILQIQDTGTGIASEHLPHLFERFYQVRGTKGRTHEGSGIGLALVHELVRLHGGTIEVNSILGEGTCFTVSLPFGTEHLPSERLRRGKAERLQDEGDSPAETLRERILPVRTLASTAMSTTAYVEEAERWLPEESRGSEGAGGDKSQWSTGYSSPASPASSARVLLVDDNADMREYLTRILGEHVQVEAVADGATALAIAQERVPNLILSDVMMPGLDGFELLGALRADLRTREVPIILLSARAGEEAIVEGLEAGADDYLIKPFSAQELVSRVTAHLQMARLRGEALRQERIINRQKDEFISVVSHELNTPLVSILGWTRLLRSSPPNPVMLSKALDTIERNATLQGKLVQDLLELTRISAGKIRLNPQPIELQPVIESAITSVTQTATDKGIHLTWQENVTEPVVLMGDRDRLQQVVCNLLTNAIKFTPESGNITLELSVINDGHTSDTSYAEIRVTDTGIGIAADFLPHVFDYFRQADETNAAKGLGLGLAISRHIVELHNGTIHAESPGEEQGATFTVRLPLLRNDES